MKSPHHSVPQYSNAGRPADRGFALACVSIAIAGSGGAGAMTTATLLIEAAGEAGWYGYMTRSSGAQIRGGEALAIVRLSSTPIDSHAESCDLLVAIDWENVGRFAAEIRLSGESLVLGDPNAGEPAEDILAYGARFAPVALSAAAEAAGRGGRANMVALGVVAGLIGLPAHHVRDVLERTLTAKGEAAVLGSRAAVKAGFDLARALPAVPRLADVVDDGLERWSVTGNELAGLGAIRGGVRFVAAYPITPGTEILEWLAPNLANVGGVLVQAEDELASVNQVIGASYAGVPALTATSGPGLSLMSESIGLAVAAEIPIVIIDVMRIGPSTGVPVKSEQGDLNLACYGLHGDAPHLVVAPLSVSDCMFATQWAVHLAEVLQTPAIVLSDQSMGQARAVIPKPAEIAFIASRELAQLQDGERYRRYAVTPSGISPMAVPGTAGLQYTADGLEHNEFGVPSSGAMDHRAQLDKRRRKVEGYDFGEHWAEIDADDGAEVAIVTWGSVTGPAREAAGRLRVLGIPVRLVALRLLAPLRSEWLAATLAGVRRLLVVEQSHGAQFVKYLRANCDFEFRPRSFAMPGPLPIAPDAIVNRILQWE